MNQLRRKPVFNEDNMAADKALDGFILGAIAIILGAMFGWLAGIIVTSLLQNSTGGYDSTVTANIAPVITPILIVFGVMIGFIIMIYSAKHAAR